MKKGKVRKDKSRYYDVSGMRIEVKVTKRFLGEENIGLVFSSDCEDTDWDCPEFVHTVHEGALADGTIDIEALIEVECEEQVKRHLSHCRSLDLLSSLPEG